MVLGPNCITILPTYQCTAACTNCCFGSHPWVKGRIPQAEILRYIHEAASIPTIKLVVFSGGESFLLKGDLEEALSLATSLGLSTRCVTNAWWAVSRASAREFLAPYVAAGLADLRISAGDNHQVYIPLARVLYAARAAYDHAIDVVVTVEYTIERSITAETLRGDPLFSEIFSEQETARLLIRESPWLPMDTDNAPLGAIDLDTVLNSHNAASRSGCRSILTTLVATPQQELYACCGLTFQQTPELRLGLLSEKSMPNMYRDATEDFLKIWLAVDGPEKILAWAASYDPSLEWENRFIHQCGACRFMYRDEKVRRVIRDHAAEVVPDVLLRFEIYRKETNLEVSMS
jgi:hypothetical protein